MCSTLHRRLVPTVTALVLLAAGAAGAAAPAQARSTTDSRMPVTATRAVLDQPVTAVTPLGAATTVAGLGRPPVPGWPTPQQRRVTRSGGVDPAAEVVRLVNVARANAGCRALHVDVHLTAAARLHSEDMARRNYFSHTSLDGRSPWDRIRAQGYAYASAENIAAGQRTPAAVMTAWMNSPGHRANILNCSSAAIGVGIGRNSASTYGIYWTQDFGTR
jgi:uncharacterized protein YkwD